MAKQGTVIAVGGLGVLLVWSGVSNKGFLASVRDVIQGVQPTAGPKQSFLSGSGTSTTSSATPSGSVSGGTVSSDQSGGQQDQATRDQNKVLAQSMAAGYGWESGAEWTAFDAVVMQESGYDALAANPSSGARGIAQKIDGWSSNYQKGNAAQQIAWMLAYIKSRYGDPIKAEQFHLANNWY